MRFEEKVWLLLKQIPRGRVTSYKEIARVLNTKAYRAVGKACGRNPFAPKFPCHRVVSNNGGIGGYSGGIKKKIKLLEKEGIRVKNGRIMDFDQVFFKFSNK